MVHKHALGMVGARKRSRVQRTRDGTPAQPARALVVVCVNTDTAAPCPTACWGGGGIRRVDDGTGTPKLLKRSVPCKIIFF